MANKLFEVTLPDVSSNTLTLLVAASTANEISNAILLADVSGMLNGTTGQHRIRRLLDPERRHDCDYTLPGDLGAFQQRLRDHAAKLPTTGDTDDLHEWESGCGRLVLKFKGEHVDAIAQPGKNDAAVEAACKDEFILAQLRQMDQAIMRQCVHESGVDEAATMDEARLFNYFVWLAAWDVFDGKFD